MHNSTAHVEQFNYVGHAVQLYFPVMEFNCKLLACLMGHLQVCRDHFICLSMHSLQDHEGTVELKTFITLIKLCSNDIY